MPEPNKHSPEKGPNRARSFGPPLLLLFFLILMVMYVGSGTLLSTPQALTQDQYLWNLYNGNVARQEFKGLPQGTNAIEGALQGSLEVEREEKPRSFEVSFSDVAQNEELFRSIASELRVGQIGLPVLLQAVEDGWYEPRRMRLLSAYQRETPPPAAGAERAKPAGEAAESRARAVARTRQQQALWVEVLARSRGAYESALIQEHGSFDPTRDLKFELPEAPGQFWTRVEISDDADLALALAALQKSGATLEAKTFNITPTEGSRWGDSSSHALDLLILWGPWLIILAVFLFFLRQVRSQGGAGGVMNFGRSRAQVYSKENRTNVTFDDVAGAEEAKSEVRELVEFLKNPGRFTRIGGRIPRGVCLVGPPGCGKTLLAKAIAGEAEVPFFSISGSDFVEMFVGVGASRVRDLFKQARESSPCIIFLDEIDAVGRRRGSGMGGGHDEREQTLNAILVEMDGFGTDEGIIVIAATNRPDVLDPALLRPGRFDRQVVIDLPDVEGRKSILSVHLKKVKHGPDVDVDALSRGTPGYSGADLAAIVNEAAIMAVLDKREQVSMADLDEAREKVIYGRQKRSRKMEEEDRRIVAYHEAGHAVVAAAIPEVDPPSKVTIVPRGRSLGMTTFLPEREQYHMQRRRLLGMLAVGFGGRVAEQEFCGDISAGASDDIRRATDLARTMVTELGMSDAIGPIHYAERQGSDFLGTELMRGKSHSEDTAREIDQEVQRLLSEAYERAVGIV
ncbi:MAG: ATP-dependent zinc metalloprotease FtsH, partial [Planctomycetes bacterium]|nr:ATP-dependent zinc metalloprotease FtsH [Planctomycetota bacterium]